MLPLEPEGVGLGSEPHWLEPWPRTEPHNATRLRPLSGISQLPLELPRAGSIDKAGGSTIHHLSSLRQFSREAKSSGSAVRQTLSLLALWSWGNYLASLCLSCNYKQGRFYEHVAYASMPGPMLIRILHFVDVPIICN